MIYTVNGNIEESDLGVTYSHEHLIVKPNKSDGKYYEYTLDDIKKSTIEAANFKDNGGKTIVEMTPINYGRDVSAYKKISEEVKINIICCTGFHKEEFLPDWVYNKNDNQIYQIIMDEIEYGIDNSGIKPGVLKIGTSLNQISAIEKRLIRIISSVQKKTGLPINTHCDKGTMAIEQAELLINSGVEADRIIVGHVDIPNNQEYLENIVKLGVNISIDHVGRSINNDISKIQMIKNLIDEGYRDKIFISGDMGKKSYLESYGGKPGLRYILSDFKSEFIKKLDYSDFEHILINNPKRLFRIRRKVK